MRFSHADARALASVLEVDYRTVPICLACLTFVSFPLDLGDEEKAGREAVALGPHFWEDGLADAVWASLEQACERRVDRAAEAIRELERLGPRSELVAAIVLRLAHAQVEEMRARWPR